MRTKNLTAKTSKNQKPNPHPFYGDNYERGTDPFHFSTAPIELQDDPSWNRGKKKEGWYLLDNWKNQIGFIPDGTIIQAQAANQTRKKGRDKDE